MEWLAETFFRRDPVDCARKLIGATFVWDGCEGRIVETEAYATEGDEACHTSFRPGARAFVENHSAGTAYVYLNYGVHWLFNVLVKGPHGAGFVLFRALEPTVGIGQMQARRAKSGIKELCSGPGKLTRAFGIDGSIHGQRFLAIANRGIRRGPAVAVVTGERIGISRAQTHPWRFHEDGNAHVSR